MNKQNSVTQAKPQPLTPKELARVAGGNSGTNPLYRG